MLFIRESIHDSTTKCVSLFLFHCFQMKVRGDGKTRINSPRIRLVLYYMYHSFFLISMEYCVVQATRRVTLLLLYIPLSCMITSSLILWYVLYYYLLLLYSFKLKKKESWWQENKRDIKSFFSTELGWLKFWLVLTCIIGGINFHILLFIHHTTVNWAHFNVIILVITIIANSIIKPTNQKEINANANIFMNTIMLLMAVCPCICFNTD